MVESRVLEAPDELMSPMDCRISIGNKGLLKTRVRIRTFQTKVVYIQDSFRTNHLEHEDKLTAL